MIIEDQTEETEQERNRGGMRGSLRTESGWKESRRHWKVGGQQREI